MLTSVQQLKQEGPVVGRAVSRAVSRSNCDFCGQPGDLLYSDMSDWLFGVKGEWSMRRCILCHVAWLDPRPNENDVPELYARYMTHGADQEMSWFGRMQRSTWDAVLSRRGYRMASPKAWLPHLLSFFPGSQRTAMLTVVGLPPTASGKLLDVGCGNGVFIERIRQLGWEVAGVEPDPMAAAAGRKRGLEIVTGSIADVPETSRFDVIVLNHVIEHVADPVQFLRDCRTRLNSGGRVILTTPNLDSLGHRVFKKYWRGLEVPRHFTIFSVEGLRGCVERAGLRVAAISTETRLAPMIYHQSARARTGADEVGQHTTSAKWSAKIAAHLFRLYESILVNRGKNVGEELFCTCSNAVEG